LRWRFVNNPGQPHGGHPQWQDHMNFLQVAVPVYNEEARLARGLPPLQTFLAALSAKNGFDYEIVIADNGSTDRTQAVAEGLCAKFPNVRVRSMPERGRGRALKTVWMESQADILAYMDVDLSTDLAAFPALVDAISCKGFDVAVGARRMPGARVQRSWKRELTSRGYIALTKAFLGARFTDPQCGFKAISQAAARELLPQVRDTGWFFDTELLALAEWSGMRIFEHPVAWREDADSRVKVLRTAWEDLKGLWRLRRSRKAGLGGAL
jgi:glycosyltransferase involved in cell wall biosynthesis